MESIRTHFPSEPIPAAPCHMDTLPTEMLGMILSFLPQRDQVEAREVCRRWAQVLPISSRAFSNLTTFALSPTTNAYSTLLESGAAWKHVKITGMASTPESQDWFCSLEIWNVRRLEFRNSNFKRTFLQSSLQKFPHLDQLEFINCQMDISGEAEGGQIGTEAVPTLWEEFLRSRLKSLAMEVEKNDLLLDFLNTFTCPGSCLRELILKITKDDSASHSPSYNEYEHYLAQVSSVIMVMENSCSSLKSFSLIAQSLDFLEFFWVIFPRCCQQMNHFRLRTLELILTNPDSTPILYKGFKRSSPKWCRFLGSQTELTSVSLPFLPMPLQEGEERADFIPNNLETIHISCVTAFGMPLFVQKLGKAKHMTLHFWVDTSQDQEYLTDGSHNFNSGLLGRVLPELQSLTVYDRPGRLAYTLANSCPNLRKLIINCSSEQASTASVNDIELQLIISGLIHLTVLRLNSCARITDFGVTGIGVQMMRAIRLGLDLDWSSPLFARKGAALQDLQGLEELSIEGSSQISDVAVQFGLGFRNLRQLNLATASKELTDRGLIYLTKLNPRLERLNVETNYEGMDLASVETALVTQLRSNGRWKRIDVSVRSHSSSLPTQE